MKPAFSPSVALALCLLLTSCVTDSVNPLSSPDEARADRQLVGDWLEKKDQDTFRFSMTNAHWMHVVIIPKKTNTKNNPSMTNQNPEEYDLFPTVIGNNTFLNVQVVGKDDQGNPTKNYVFLRYTIISNHVLQMWMISQDAAAAAVRAGKLKGIVHEDKNALMVGHPPHPDVDVNLQDSSRHLAKYVQSADVKSLFSDKMETLYRVTPTQKQELR